MLGHRRVTPGIKFAGTHLFTWVERGTVRDSYLRAQRNVPGQGSNPDRSPKHTNHEATTPSKEEPRYLENVLIISGWCCGESARFAPKWPGFFPGRSPHHLWVEFVVDCQTCSKGFSSGFWFSFFHINLHSNSNWT